MIQTIVKEPKKQTSALPRLFGSRQLTGSTRCALIVAHPGDEIFGAGYLMAKVGTSMVMHLTNGVIGPKGISRARSDNVSEYAETRWRECVAALKIIKVPARRIARLELQALEASFHLTQIARRVVRFLQRAAPDIVLTHAYEGAHPDHDAAAFATHAALKLLRQNGFKPPTLFEMAIRPDESGNGKVAEFLTGDTLETTTLSLDRSAQRLKLRMFDLLTTQRESLVHLPLESEKYRESPHYDFRYPPRSGQLNYEKLGWFSGSEWQALARESWKELFQDPKSTMH